MPSVMPAVWLAMLSIAEELSGRDGDLNDGDALFDVPYSTLSVGTIHGGTATNIVPNLCEFTFDYRNLPHMTQEDILAPIQAKVAELTAQMQARAPETGIELFQEVGVPAMTDDDSAELQQLISSLVADDKRHKVAYATEGGQFTNAGIPRLSVDLAALSRRTKQMSMWS